jgi:hypothetical protein
MASQSHRMCVADSSFSKHLSQMGLSVSPILLFVTTSVGTSNPTFTILLWYPEGSQISGCKLLLQAYCTCFHCVVLYLFYSFGRRIPLIAGTLLCFLGGVATLVTSGFIMLLTSRFVIGLGHLTTSYMAQTLGMFFHHIHIFNYATICNIHYLWCFYSASSNLIIGVITDSYSVWPELQ